MTHAILSTMGTGGDVFPFVTMGRALAAAGTRVTIVTNACYLQDIQAAGLGGASVDTPAECDDMIRDGAWLATGRGLLAFADRHVAPRLDREVDIIRGLAATPDTLLIARAGASLAARIVADDRALRIVSVIMAPANVLGWRLYEDLVQARLGTVVNACRRRLGLAPVEHWPAWLACRETVGLWPEWFCPPEATPFPGLRLAGFVPAEDWAEGEREDGAEDAVDTEVRRALDAGPPSVLIAGGTGYFGGETFFQSAVEGCRAAGFRPVIVCRRPELVPAELPPDSIILDRVPSLAALMRRVAIVCHHGGMGTLGQALAAGVPQLVMASGGDRPDNAQRLQALGVAVAIGPLHRERSRVTAALQWLAASPDVRARCAALAARLRTRSVHADLRASLRQHVISGC